MFTALNPLHSHHTLHYQLLSLHLSVSMRASQLIWLIAMLIVMFIVFFLVWTFDRLWAPPTTSPCSYSSSCMARQNHRLIKTTATGVLCFYGDAERQRNGTDTVFNKNFGNEKKKALHFSPTPVFPPLFQQYKHLFVHIGPSNPSYSDPVLESIDVRQIYDKFSEKKGGLKELYEKGPHNAFFLVKFWVSTQN